MEVIDDLLQYVKEPPKSQNKHMSNSALLYQLELPIPQNRPVGLVPWFVGVHHILYTVDYSSRLLDLKYWLPAKKYQPL